MGERPILSVIVPTVGRPSLERALRSIRHPADTSGHVEVVLVGDTHAGTWTHQLPLAKRLAVEWPHVKYVEHDGGVHAWGHPQRNAGIAHATGRHLCWLGDDDMYLRGGIDVVLDALSAQRIRDGGADDRVHLFRWIAPWRTVMWQVAGFLEQDHIDAECVVCSNDPDRLGVWRNRYQGDFDFIAETVDKFGGPERVIWQPDVIAQAQPSDAEDWTLGGREHPPQTCLVAPLTVLAPVPPRVEVPA